MRRLLLALVLAASAAAVPASAEAVGFNSPSGNIGCVLFPGQVRCDIREKDWSPPPKPASCEFEWGYGTQIRRGQRKGRLVCASDTALTRGNPLAYGKTIRRGKIRCKSTKAGIRCKLRNGHGFFISRERYDLF